ncbi:MAG: DUF3137 domain-containing protein [Vampirovibrio sp.]|nr:DUF3137 domain-containing protein [Vampirovibrio sp.]
MMTSTFAEIKTLYDEKIVPYVGRVNSGIKSVDWLFKGSIAITFILTFTLYFSNQDNLHFSGRGKGRFFAYLTACIMSHPWEFVVIVVLSVIIFNINFSWFYQRYLPFFLWDIFVESTYQEFVIPPLLKKINRHLILTGEGQFPRKIITDSGLFPTIDWHEYFSTFTLQQNREGNLILGQVSTRKILPEIHLNEIAHPSTFTGLMARVAFPASRGYELYLLADFSERAAAGMLKHNQASRVLMDNPTFENYFHVYETDSIRAHYLLSTKVLEQLADFRHKIGSPVSIALKNGYCYLALHHYPSPFVPQQRLTEALTLKGIYSQYLHLEKLFSGLDFLKELGKPTSF